MRIYHRKRSICFPNSKMKKLLSILLVVLASCTYHDLHEGPCYLASEHNLSGEVSYFYNAKNELISYSASNVYSSVLSYDDSGKIISEVDNQILSITYSYDDKNRLTLWSQVVQNYTGYNSQIKFFYNALDQDTLQQFYRYNMSSNTYYLWRYARREFVNNKNYSKVRTFDANTNVLLYTEEFLWDSHPNPYLTNAFFLNSPPPTNNMTRYTFTNAGAAPETFDYVYTYNSKGFPIEKRDPSNNTFISSYIYTNCK